MLSVLQVIADYVTPLDKNLCRDLEAKIKPYIKLEVVCSVSLVRL